MQREQLKDAQTEIRKNNILISMLLCDISNALRVKVIKYQYKRMYDV